MSKTAVKTDSPGPTASIPHWRDRFQSLPAPVKTAAILGLIWLGFVVWRREVITLPPYYEATFAPFREADYLAESGFDYWRLRYQELPANDGGPYSYMTSIVPTLLAILMRTFDSPTTVVVITHLCTFGCAAVIVLAMYRLLRPPCDAAFAALVTLAAVTTPLALAQFEMMALDVPLTMFALLAAMAVGKNRFGLAALAVTGAFLAKPTGLIVTMAVLAFLGLAIVVDAAPGVRSGARRMLARALAMSVGVFALQAALYWWGGLTTRLRQVGFTKTWVHDISYMCPDVGILVAICLVVIAALVIWWIGSSLPQLVRTPLATTRGAFQYLVSQQPVALFSAIVAAGMIGAIYVFARVLVIRYVLIVIPFTYIVLAALIYRPARPRLMHAIPAILVLVNLYNTDGRLFPKAIGNRRHCSILERSREYLADLKSHVAAMRKLEAECHGVPIVAGYPFCYYLSFPRYGYVTRPLAGYGIMPVTHSQFRDAVDLFHDRPDRLIFTSCENPSHRWGPLSPPTPIAGDRVIYDDGQPSPLRIFERDLRQLPNQPASLDQWYLDQLWAHEDDESPRPLWTSRAAYLIERKRPDLAIRMLESHVAKDERDLTARLRLAELLIESGRVQESIRHSCGAIRESVNQRNTSTYAEAQYLLGVAMLAQRRVEDAQARFAEVLKTVPHHAEAQFQLGVSYLTQHRAVDAQREFAAVLREKPEHAAAHYHLGLAQEQEHQRTEALLAYNRAIQLQPNYFDAVAQMAQSLLASDRKREAADYFRHALRLRPDWRPGLQALAWLLATDGDALVRNGAEAVRHADVLCRQTQFQDPTVLDTLAAACAEAGDYPRAVEMQRRAIELNSQSAQPANVEALRQRLELYQRGRPYRQSVGS